MSIEQFNEIRSILVAHKGDDLYRAQLTFRTYTPTQMKQPWGASGKTCQELLDGYREQEQHIDDLIKAFDTVKPTKGMSEL